jgi:hypothetical protein
MKIIETITKNLNRERAADGLKAKIIIRLVKAFNY